MDSEVLSRSGSDGGGGGGMRMRPPSPRERARPRSRELPSTVPPAINRSDLMKTLMEIQQQKDTRPKNLREAFPDMERCLSEVNSTKHLWFQPSLTKTQAADMLCTSRPRSFIVRESQKEPGAYAVTARAPEELVRRSQNPPIPPGTYIPGRMCIRHFRIFPRPHGGGYSISGWGNCYFETISEWIVAFTVIGPDPNYALELPRLPNPDPNGAASMGYSIIGEFMVEGKPVDPKEWYTSLLTRALKEGSVKVRTSVITMHGAPGTGKSSFQDLVLGRPPLPVRHSTPLTMSPVRTMAGERAFVDSKSDDSSCKWMSVRPDDLMGLIAEAVKKIDEMPPPPPSPFLQRPPSFSSSASVALPSSPPQTQKKSLFGLLNRGKKPKPSSVSQDPVTSVTSEPASSLATASSAEALEPQIDHSGAAQNLLELLSTAAKSDQLFNIHWIYIIDSGGQPQFQDILPLFVRNNMINVITFRLTQTLDDKPIFEFVHEGKHVCQPIDLQLTNLELIQSLVRSLCTFQQVLGNDKPVGARFVLVGTFADQIDQCKDESIADKNKRLVAALEAYAKFRIDYNPGKEVIVAVNAVVEKDREKEAERMRVILTRALEATGIQEIEIPLRWFVLELDISRIANKKNQFVLLLSECIEAGRKLGMSREEVIEALKYFDRSALYLYFPDCLPELVFVYPQPLLNKLTEIIVITFADSLDLIPIAIIGFISAGDYSRLKEDGVFKLSLLKCLPDGFIKGVFEEKDFLALLEYLLIVAPIRQEGKDVEYFLPCVLPRQSLTDEQKYNFVSQSDSWILTWSSEPTPVGLFPATVVHLLTRKESPFFKLARKTPTFPCQLRNAVRLACNPQGGAVLIVDNHCWMEIYYSGDPSLCPEVRKAVFDAILFAGTKLHYSDLLETKQEGFMCSFCTGSPAHPCTVTTLHNGKVQATCTQDPSVSRILTDRRKLVWLAIADREPDFHPPPSPLSSSGFNRENLMNDLAAKVPNKWRKIGTQLKLTLNQLDAIGNSEHDPVDQCMMMLDWWQRFDTTRRPFSWTTIVDVLRSNAVGEESLANELNTKYC